VPRPQRGDEGPEAHPRPRGSAHHVILLFTYVAVTIAAMMYAGLGEDGTGLGNEANADDFFLAIKDGLLGPWGWLLVVAVLISAVSSTQTTILPTARGTLAMGVYRALPARFKTCTRCTRRRRSRRSWAAPWRSATTSA
jgi:amino acid transporter